MGSFGLFSKVIERFGSSVWNPEWALRAGVSGRSRVAQIIRVVFVCDCSKIIGNLLKLFQVLGCVLLLLLFF